MPLVIGSWQMDNFFVKPSALQLPSKYHDCYFYFYSTCRKGKGCQFRHEPSARGHEIVCEQWLNGYCQNIRCRYRHMIINKPRKSIQCFWETTPYGCRKPHCVFSHLNKDTANDNTTFYSYPEPEHDNEQPSRANDDEGTETLISQTVAQPRRSSYGETIGDLTAIPELPENILDVTDETVTPHNSKSDILCEEKKNVSHSQYDSGHGSISSISEYTVDGQMTSTTLNDNNGGENNRHYANGDETVDVDNNEELDVDGNCDLMCSTLRSPWRPLPSQVDETSYSLETIEETSGEQETDANLEELDMELSDTSAQTEIDRSLSSCDMEICT